MFAGMAGLAAETTISGWMLLAALVGWIVVPLALASALFARRQL